MAVHHGALYGIPPKPERRGNANNRFYRPLKPLLHASRDGPQVAVHLAGVLAQDQADNGFPCHMDVLEPSEDVDL
jgi:hypothetical protein